MCQAPTPPPPARLPRAFTRVASSPRGSGVPRVWLRRSGAGPSPTLAPAPRSPRRTAPRAPPHSARAAPASTAHPIVRPPGAAGLCAGSPGRGADSLGAGAEGPRAATEARAEEEEEEEAGGGGGEPDGGGGGREEEESRQQQRLRRELGRPPPPPPPRERRAPRPGSHASHVRPLGEAAPRRRPRRVMRTDVKLPYEY